MNKIRNSVSKVVNGANYLGMAICFVMVFVVSIDVILRKLSGQALSIPGSNEFSSYFLIVMTMLAIPTLQVKKGHIWVNMFVDKFPPKFRNIWLGCIMSIETVVCAFFTYSSFRNALNQIKTGRATDVLNMPWWPFAFVCAFGFAELTVMVGIDTIIHFVDAKNGGEAIAE